MQVTTPRFDDNPFKYPISNKEYPTEEGGSQRPVAGIAVLSLLSRLELGHWTFLVGYWIFDSAPNGCTSSLTNHQCLQEVVRNPAVQLPTIGL